jgi:hypothetical protein
MNPLMHRTRSIISLTALALAVATVASAQAPAPPAPPKSPKAAAPMDLTGYWVAIITEDWRFRMLTPPKGDYASVPITPSAKKLADTWDPAKDEAAGEQCKSYAAPALMRVASRFHITWQDDNTLKVESDNGMQTRLLHFGDWKPAPGSAPTWQGESRASWEVPATRVGGGSNTETISSPGGSMKVATTRLRPGYLRKNGVPLRRERAAHRILGREQGNEWRPMDGHYRAGRRPRLFAGTMGHGPALQEGTERRQVGSHSVLFPIMRRNV